MKNVIVSDDILLAALAPDEAVIHIITHQPQYDIRLFYPASNYAALWEKVKNYQGSVYSFRQRQEILSQLLPGIQIIRDLPLNSEFWVADFYHFKKRPNDEFTIAKITTQSILKSNLNLKEGQIFPFKNNKQTPDKFFDGQLILTETSNPVPKMGQEPIEKTLTITNLIKYLKTEGLTLFLPPLIEEIESSPIERYDDIIIPSKEKILYIEFEKKFEDILKDGGSIRKYKIKDNQSISNLQSLILKSDGELADIWQIYELIRIEKGLENRKISREKQSEDIETQRKKLIGTTGTISLSETGTIDAQSISDMSNFQLEAITIDLTNRELDYIPLNSTYINDSVNYIEILELPLSQTEKILFLNQINKDFISNERFLKRKSTVSDVETVIIDKLNSFKQLLVLGEKYYILDPLYQEILQDIFFKIEIEPSTSDPYFRK